jgi:OOP family OmpA-OmpF porin
MYNTIFFIKHPLNMNKLILVLVCLIFPALIMAQSKSEVGLMIGGANYQGDLASAKIFSFKQTQVGGGFYARYHVNRHISLRGNFFYTKLQGDDLDFVDEAAWRADRAFNFTNSVYELSFTPEFHLLGNTIKRKLFRPYIFVGIGAAFTNPETNLVERDIEAVENEPGYYATSHFSFPLGGGINFDINDKFTLGFEASTHFPLTDYLDGVSESGNPNKKDWFVFGGLTLGYKFGKDIPTYVDTDGDGVNDDTDLCPFVAGKLQGCPDVDSDGIADLQDDCPNLAGDKRFKGCPDSDSDGIADINDLCPDTRGAVALNGCPDSDADGIADHKDNCPDLAGSLAQNGCPKDTDGDGIYDIADNCPTEKGNLNGCPDSDADGIADAMDDCPLIAGIHNNKGCPDVLVAKGEVEVVDLRAEADLNISTYTYNYLVGDLYFNQTRAKISKNEIAKLDEVAKLMNKNAELNLKIIGHTDDTGDMKLNDHLSMRRARRCYKYLASKGISLNRMFFEGSGAAEPKYDNSTEEGKRLNRRVVFAFLK